MKVAVFTLGCKLNQCESEALADAFNQHGFTVVPHYSQADVYIVNTCTVTSRAEQKARRMIRKFAAGEHAPAVIVTGCYAELEPDELRRLQGTIHIVPLSRKQYMLRLPAAINGAIDQGYTLDEAIAEWLRSDDGEAKAENGYQSKFDYKAVTFQYHARAFLKIEDGCDNSCAYCRVSIARGKAVSLHQEEVVRRALELEERGYREIVLTGVNITAYRDGESDLADLITLLGRMLTTAQIRLSSLEPDMVTEKLAEACSSPLVQPHFHLPVQSGSDLLLRRANRHYTAEDVLIAVRLLRSVKEDPFIAADIITGLPGEGDVEFGETVRLLQRGDFAQIHVFPFSPRPGTDLYDAPQKVPEALRDDRAKTLRELSARQHAAYIRRWRRKQVSVILERRHESYWQALADNYLRVRVQEVPPDIPEQQLRGSLCRVRLTELHSSENIIYGLFDRLL